MVGFPYTYGDIKDVGYEIKWVKNLVLKGTVHQTYKITQIISKYGLVKKVRIIFVTFVFVLGLSFASSEPVELIIQEKTQIEKQIVNSSLGQTIENSKNTSATSISRGGDLGKGSSPGARAKSNARAAVNKKVNDGKALKSKPGRKGVAEALTVNSFDKRRPASLNCLVRKFQPGPTLDPYNPGCGGGPRSITVLSGQSNEEIKVVVANDGSIINIEIAQVRDKGLHIPDFVDIDISNSRFNRGKIKKLKKLDYQDRLNYLRNKGNLSDKIVYEARDEILDFMTAPDTMMVPGFLRSSKIEGTVFINMRLGKIGFRDYGTNKFRTALSMDKKQIEDVANEGFHLFPKAGNR
jgi:hypothetical protein